MPARNAVAEGLENPVGVDVGVDVPENVPNIIEQYEDVQNQRYNLGVVKGVNLILEECAAENQVFKEFIGAQNKRIERLHDTLMAIQQIITDDPDFIEAEVQHVNNGENLNFNNITTLNPLVSVLASLAGDYLTISNMNITPEMKDFDIFNLNNRNNDDDDDTTGGIGRIIRDHLRTNIRNEMISERMINIMDMFININEQNKADHIYKISDEYKQLKETNERNIDSIATEYNNLKTTVETEDQYISNMIEAYDEKYNTKVREVLSRIESNDNNELDQFEKKDMLIRLNEKLRHYIARYNTLKNELNLKITNNNNVLNFFNYNIHKLNNLVTKDGLHALDETENTLNEIINSIAEAQLNIPDDVREAFREAIIEYRDGDFQDIKNQVDEIKREEFERHTKFNNITQKISDFDFKGNQEYQDKLKEFNEYKDYVNNDLINIGSQLANDQLVNNNLIYYAIYNRPEIRDIEDEFYQRKNVLIQILTAFFDDLTSNYVYDYQQLNRDIQNLGKNIEDLED